MAGALKEASVRSSCQRDDWHGTGYTGTDLLCFPASGQHDVCLSRHLALSGMLAESGDACTGGRPLMLARPATGCPPPECQGGTHPSSQPDKPSAEHGLPCRKMSSLLGQPFQVSGQLVNKPLSELPQGVLFLEQCKSWYSNQYSGRESWHTLYLGSVGL